MLPPEDTTAPVRTDHAALAVGSRDVALSASLRERLTDAAYPLFAKRGIRDVSLEEIERRYVTRVLESVGGNKSAAARILRIERKTLYRMMDRWGLDPK